MNNQRFKGSLNFPIKITPILTVVHHLFCKDKIPRHFELGEMNLIFDQNSRIFRSIQKWYRFAGM